MLQLWNTGGLPYTKLCHTDLLLQYHFALYAILGKINQQKHTLFLFKGIFMAWYDTLHKKACHVLHAGVHYILTHGFGIFLHILQRP